MARGPWKGRVTRPCTVTASLTEVEYARLMELRARDGFASTSDQLRSLILAYLASCTESGQPHPADTAAD